MRNVGYYIIIAQFQPCSIPVQVVAGLIGTATTEKNGLMSASIMRNIAGSYTIRSKKLYSINGDSCAIFNVYGWSANTIIMFTFKNLMSYQKIIGALTERHFSLYKDDNKFYIKSVNIDFNLTCIAASSNVTVEEVDIDESTLTKLQ